MNVIITLSTALLGAVIAGFWGWAAKKLERQAKRQKAILLGVQWLIEKAESKPTSYVTTLIEDALKDD